jgi:predicted TIM-barrel fold metal-dependent hydrolase
VQVGLDTVERSLYNKIVFGTNYPRVDMRRFARGLHGLGLSLTTEQAITAGNASRILKLMRQP